MKKYILLSTMGLALLSACSDDPSTTEGEEPADSGPVTVTDQAGNEVTIPEDPSRIVASYLEDPLVTLGITPVRQWSVLERSSTQVYLEEQLAGIEPIDFNLPLEALMEAEPDLVFASGEDSMASGSYDQYSKIAPTYVIDNETKDDWRATLTLMGEVLGKDTEAEAAINEYDAHVAEIKNQLNEEIGDSKVAALWVIGGKFFVVAPDVASGAVLFEDLELTPANLIAELPENTGAHWNPVSLEAIAELDADYLFLIDSDPETIENLENESIWSNIPAVEQGHIYNRSGTSSWLYNGYQANTQTIDSVYEAIIGE
ncbi:iron complex transport system substrate-binding protein [Alkalihalobacillus xiaoxiensis]|uniref:Iron complex transport system substrate-binding protein n=1 Tax=Shouchella xiaoxiensis TaxID=766895 RepID=A0ABS2SN63_9BACI|nr:ABC transporter substrate-binding protein [Shouchella xiaoxiensis]MBM7836959.1 iron complex transport system substrate-binding protein [Shouchella xiaoxiensis]